jgi:hypothetical protein
VLCRRGATVQERDEILFGNDWRGDGWYRFCDEGNATARNRRMAGCMLMMVYKTEGTVAEAAGIIMMMGHRHERGDQEQDYEKSCQALMPAHEIPPSDGL